jgi:tRNA A37 N6-isopentenylltransferase MiaA
MTTIQLELTPDLEQKLRGEAAKQGVDPSHYILNALVERLNSSDNADAPSNLEAELLQKINAALPQMDWEHYHSLIAKRQSETITSDELNILVSITDRLEIANAQRIQHLIELAKLRGKSLEDVIADLGIKPASYL